jgi:hypothetical protein
MLYPEIVILAVGGSHGDFLLKSCEIITKGKNVNIAVNNDGRVDWVSYFKKKMNMSFHKGNKKFVKLQTDKCNKIELSHIYYDEFNKWSTKFFYIDFSKKHLDVVLDMYIKKVCNNDINKILFHIKQYISDDLCKKINKENYKEVLRISWWNAIQKYKKLKNIKKINILSFYDFENTCKILKELKVYNEQHLKIYEEFYQKWHKNNKKFIQNMIKT